MNVSLPTPRSSTSVFDHMNAMQFDVDTLKQPRTRSGVVAKQQEEQQQQQQQQQSNASDASPPMKKKRVYKKRKATHTVRKEEKQALETEIYALEAILEQLKLQTIMQNGEEDTALSKKQEHNVALREVVQAQHLVLAHAQGMLQGCTLRHSYEVCPTEMFIHLTADRAERHKTIKTLRGPKLFYARRFIQQRSLGMHPTAEYLHEERYETPEGDYCNVRFDRVALRGVRGGIRAVLNALHNAMYNAEIIISETSGNITIREDDDLTEEDFFQLRLVTQSNRGFLVENNLVHFTDFCHDDAEGSYAVASADFVDVDDRFPYRPHERVRRDATAAILVTSHVDSTMKKEFDGVHNSSEEPVVVVTRWAFTRICRTELHISHQVLREMRNLSGRVSEMILNCVRETTGAPR